MMKRWWKFNAVGIAGVIVQLAVLHLCVTGCRTPYLVATVIAVEAAVLHNFVWHERWTWRDRAHPESQWTRLIAFHTSNGIISLAGNILFMRLFVGSLGMPIIAANLAAIVMCSTANFIASNTIVYRGGLRSPGFAIRPHNVRDRTPTPEPRHMSVPCRAARRDRMRTWWLPRSTT